MDEEAPLAVVKLALSSYDKEGPAFSAESFASNYKVLVKSIGPSRPPSATERHALAAERRIEDVCRERDRMAQELVAARHAHADAIRDLRSELTAVIATYRERLDWFEPHYEGLKRDYDNIKSLHLPSLGMITVGGVLLSSASFFPSDILRFSALATGILATLYGLWTQILIVRKSPPAQERPSGRPGSG
jgi:hypothetical protein